VELKEVKVSCMEDALTALAVALKMNYTLIIDWKDISESATRRFGAAVPKDTE